MRWFFSTFSSSSITDGTRRLKQLTHIMEITIEKWRIKRRKIKIVERPCGAEQTLFCVWFITKLIMFEWLLTMCLRYSIYGVIQHKTAEVSFNSKENDCPLNELTMTTRWKKREKRNFHWTRMCLSLRLGPIDVNWKQSLFDGARESPFVFHQISLSINGSSRDSMKNLFSSCISSDFWSALYSKLWKLHQTSINTLWKYPRKGQAVKWSKVKSLVLVCTSTSKIRFDTKSTAKQQCRLRFLMSKYCCDLKWSFMRFQQHL